MTNSFLRKIGIFLSIAFLCGFFLAFLRTHNSLTQPSTRESLPVILLDPGHGGYDGGTGEGFGILEKDIVLNFAFLLKAELEKYKFPVYLTRTTDADLSKAVPYRGSRQGTDLYGRVYMIQRYNAQIFLSLHVNSMSNPSERGAIPFFKYNSPESKHLAQCILREIKHVQPYNQQTVLPGNYYVLNASPVTSVLLELAFITNNEDRALLQDNGYLQKMAEQLAKGIHHYTVTKDMPTFFRWLVGG